MTLKPKVHPPIWRLEEAKAKFSQVVDQALGGEPQTVTRRGKETVIVVKAEQWRSVRGEEPTGLALLRHAPDVPDFVVERENGPMVERDLNLD